MYKFIDVFTIWSVLYYVSSARRRNTHCCWKSWLNKEGFSFTDRRIKFFGTTGLPICLQTDEDCWLLIAALQIFLPIIIIHSI